MKKMVYLIISFLIIIFVIATFSVINLSPKLLFNRSAYKQFPELQKSWQYDNFSMYNAGQNSNISIQYFPENNFFLISNYIELGLFNPIKINGAGNKVFELNLGEKNAFNFLETINCFIIGKNSIYDLSAENPVATPFSEVINADGKMEHKQWVEEYFGKLYNASNVVLYGYQTDITNASAVYFHHDGKWTKLYAPTKYPYFIRAEGNQVICKINKEIVAPKWHEVHFLKDVQNAIYSNEHRYSDEYITPFNSDHSFFPDQALTYSSAGKIKTLAFAKEASTTEGYFNPGIPSQFYGTAYYAIEIENNILNFKTVASRGTFDTTVQTDLHLFALPAKYSHQTDVRFLTYDYGTNFHENGKKGVYVITKNVK